MATAPDPIRNEAPSGSQLAALADAIVKLHKDTCGRGPKNARCFSSGNAVVCLLFGGLTHGEQTLIEHGEDAVVAEQRAAFYRVMHDQARDLVEQQLGRRVVAMTMGTDPANELETAVFVLDAAPDL